MTVLTDASSPQYRALASLARGVLGDGYTPEVPTRMIGMIQALPSAVERSRLFAVLRALETRAGALALTRSPVPVSWRTQEEAEAAIVAMLNGVLTPQRDVARAVVAAAVTSCYGYPGPEWERIGYPGPLDTSPSGQKTLAPMQLMPGEHLGCDVVIVGSGAGGGCTAGILAKAGLDVIVLEKGDYFPEEDFHHNEMDAMHDLYLYGGFLATNDRGCQIIAGSTLGGGTVVNYTTSFRAPEVVLRQWSEVSGIEDFASDDFQACYDRASHRLGVNLDSSAAGKRDGLLEEGLKNLGWHVDGMPRNVVSCSQDEACGFCGFGCRVGAKQSSTRTYLQDAAENNARIVVSADVDKVSVKGGRATGVNARVAGGEVTIDARSVIVAAGAIESPALLLRSGLGGRVGKGLHLHPGSATWGVFDEDVKIWEGTLQARFSAEMRASQDFYGPIFETVPVHPGVGSAAVPWLSSKDHRRRMGDFAKLSFCAVLPRDKTEGRVNIDRNGSPRVSYRIGKDDQERVLKGQIAASRVLEAAGARQIYSGHRSPITYDTSAGSHEAWVTEMERRGVDQSVTAYFSYHQMSSCSMGIDERTSAIGPDHRSHEVDDLYVIDASAFPTASGVNPMLTIYALAERASRKLAERLA